MPRLAAISILCLLSWLFVFGLFSDCGERADGSPRTYIITGAAGPLSDANFLEIDDGARKWACCLDEGLCPPEAGALIVACCTPAPDGTMLIIDLCEP